MTQAQAVAWLNSKIGQHLDYDKQYGQQCFDFFNYYYQALTGDSPYADGYAVSGAKDIWNIPNSRFDKVADSNSLVPQPGDVLIYGASWGAGFGHVEVCLSSDGNGSHLIGEDEHNNPSEGVVTVYRTWAQMAGLLGVLRPHFSQVSNGEEPMNADQEKQAYEIVLGREPEGPPSGRTAMAFILDAQAELNAQRQAAANTLAGLQKQINDLQAQANQLPELQGKVADLTSVNANLQKQIDSLKATQAATSGDTDLLNSFGKALAALIARLGLSK